METRREMMTISQLIIAEFKARKCGNEVEANRLQVQRWQQAMGYVVCSENNSNKS
jgi:hypothetical protein